MLHNLQFVLGVTTTAAQKDPQGLSWEGLIISKLAILGFQVLVQHCQQTVQLYLLLTWLHCFGEGGCVFSLHI